MSLVDRFENGDPKTIECNVCKDRTEVYNSDWLSFDDGQQSGEHSSCSAWIPRGNEGFWANMHDVDLCSPKCTTIFFWKASKKQKLHKEA